MIPGALGTAFTLAGVLAALDVAFGRHSLIAGVVLGIGAAFAVCGGLMLGWLAVDHGRPPNADEYEGMVDDDDIERMIRHYYRKERRNG